MRNAAEDVPLFHDFQEKGVVYAIMVSFAQIEKAEVQPAISVIVGDIFN